MLQDDILDTTADKNNNLLLLNKLDYGINVFLLATAILLGIISIFESDVLFILGLCNFCLGVYQLISAIVGSLRANKEKRNYLIMAIVYLMLLWLGVFTLENYIPGDLETFLMILFVLILPLCGATYFTYLCFNAKNRV